MKLLSVSFIKKTKTFLTATTNLQHNFLLYGNWWANKLLPYGWSYWFFFPEEEEFHGTVWSALQSAKWLTSPVNNKPDKCVILIAAWVLQTLHLDSCLQTDYYFNCSTFLLRASDCSIIVESGGGLQWKKSIL